MWRRLGEERMSDAPFRVLVLQDNGLNESLPLTDISAVLKQDDFHTDLLIARDEGRRFFPQIGACRPDAFLVPFDILGQAWPVRLVHELKRRHPAVPIVGVGTYVTLYTDALAAEPIDVLCRGEAEMPLRELFGRLRARADYADIPNCWVRRDGGWIKNPLRPLLTRLDDLPTPDRELYYRRYAYLRGFSTKRVVAGRGCGNRCFYCYNAVLQDLYDCRGAAFTRKKSPGRVIADIQDLRQRATVRSVYFLDDLFTDDREWLVDFGARYAREVAVPYACNLTASSADETTVRALASSGCRAVLMGVETGNEQTRRRVLNKPITDAQINRAAALFRQHRIKFLTYTMLGLPGETVDDLWRTIEFNQRLRPDYLRVTIAFPMPHTVMTQQAVQSGLMTTAQLEHIFSLPPRAQYTSSIYQTDPAHARLLRGTYYLFPLAVKRRLPRRVVSLLRRVSPLTQLLKWLSYFTVLWEEKGVFNITLRSGLRFFWHTDHPLNKTKNTNNFIP
jgi:radical SAM superfamily enzyme YgiQ (UPF0313 family)